MFRDSQCCFWQRRLSIDLSWSTISNNLLCSFWCHTSKTTVCVSITSSSSVTPFPTLSKRKGQDLKKRIALMTEQTMIMIEWPIKQITCTLVNWHSISGTRLKKFFFKKNALFIYLFIYSFMYIVLFSC